MEVVREWPWTPRFEHLLVDQSQAAVGEVRGGALGRVAQLALMAARRRVSQVRAALRMAAKYMGELARSGRTAPFGAIVRYVITTQDKQTVREFGEALRRHVPGPGGNMKTAPYGRSYARRRESTAGCNGGTGRDGRARLLGSGRWIQRDWVHSFYVVPEWESPPRDSGDVVSIYRSLGGEPE